MADDWIKFRKKLWRDGRVVTVARKCCATRATVIGGLVALWSLGDDFADETGALHGYTADDLNAEIGIENFVQSLPPDWYAELEGVPQLPEYQRHNGETAKQRAMAAKRMESLRKKRNTCYAPCATRGEKRRGEKKRGIPIAPLFGKDRKHDTAAGG